MHRLFRPAIVKSPRRTHGTPSSVCHRQNAKSGTFSIPQGGACASAPRLDTKSEPLSRLCGAASSSAGRKIHRFYGHDVCRPAIAGRKIRHILYSSRGGCASAPRLDTKSEPLSRLYGAASSSAGRKIHRFYGHDVCHPAIAGRKIRHILCSSGCLPWREICASAPRRRQKDRNRRSYYDRSQRYQPAAHPV